MPDSPVLHPTLPQSVREETLGDHPFRQHVFVLIYFADTSCTSTLLQKVDLGSSFPPLWSPPFVSPFAFAYRDIAAGRIAEGLAVEFCTEGLFTAKDKQSLLLAGRQTSPIMTRAALDFGRSGMYGIAPIEEMTARFVVLKLKEKATLRTEVMQDYAWFDLDNGHVAFSSREEEAQVLAGAAEQYELYNGSLSWSARDWWYRLFDGDGR